MFDSKAKSLNVMFGHFIADSGATDGTHHSSLEPLFNALFVEEVTARQDLQRSGQHIATYTAIIGRLRGYYRSGTSGTATRLTVCLSSFRLLRLFILFIRQ